MKKLRQSITPADLGRKRFPLTINSAFAWRLLPLVFLVALPIAVQAQFTYTTNNGTITITGRKLPRPGSSR